MRALFSPGGSRAGVDIAEAYPAVTLLVDCIYELNDEQLVRALDLKQWARRNCANTINELCDMCAIPRSKFSDPADSGKTVTKIVEDYLVLTGARTEAEWKRAAQIALIGLVTWDDAYAEVYDTDQKHDAMWNVVESVVRSGRIHHADDMRAVFAAMKKLSKNKEPVNFTSFIREMKLLEPKLAAEEKWLKTNVAGTMSWASKRCEIPIDEAKAWVLIAEALKGLPLDSTGDQKTRAARGALLADDLRTRLELALRKKAPKLDGLTEDEASKLTQLSPGQEDEFASVMRSLFHPRGEHYAEDLEGAYTILRKLSDAGTPVHRDSFWDEMLLRRSTPGAQNLGHSLSS